MNKQLLLSLLLAEKTLQPFQSFIICTKHYQKFHHTGERSFYHYN